MKNEECIGCQKCQRCRKRAMTKQSRFLGGIYCYSCYLTIMERLLECKETVDEQ